MITIIKDYSIVFAGDPVKRGKLDCSSSRTRKLIIKSASVAASVTPVRLRLTSFNGKNNGVVCADVICNCPLSD
ncbi:MAG: hypothetical protein NWE98_07650 [Candidatus Bathyarchaeota archaeon]|nr:hypothetical protein [Candidatus Bathyarchaeota archaeon]